MHDRVTAIVRGVELVLMKKQWPGEPGPDLWTPSDFRKQSGQRASSWQARGQSLWGAFTRTKMQWRPVRKPR